MAKKLILLLALILTMTTANVEAAEQRELPFETLATTYVEGGPKEVLALIKMKSDGSYFFLVAAEGADGIGMVPFSQKIYNFYLTPNEQGDYSPLIFGLMLPNQERGQADDDLGDWRDKTHLIPVYAQFNVENGQVVCGKPFSSATDLESTHFHATIQNPTHIRLVEVFMTSMPRLHEVVQANGITLP